jgi:predicted Zn-dependent protease
MGDYSGLLAIDPSTLYRIENLEFSRADEEAADEAAIVRLHRAGLSHSGLLRFFNKWKIGTDTAAPDWLSMHPSTARRISRPVRARDIAAPTPALDAAQSHALQHACK